MAKRILDELHCGACKVKMGKKLLDGKRQRMYETAWSGLFWCGDPKCAHKIMRKECERLSLRDSCNYE